MVKIIINTRWFDSLNQCFNQILVEKHRIFIVNAGDETLCFFFTADEHEMKQLMNLLVDFNLSFIVRNHVLEPVYFEPN